MKIEKTFLEKNDLRKVDGVDTGGGGGDFGQIWFHRFIHFMMTGKKLAGNIFGGK
jgi:hypothetical protein